MGPREGVLGWRLMGARWSHVLVLVSLTSAGCSNADHSSRFDAAVPPEDECSLLTTSDMHTLQLDLGDLVTNLDTVIAPEPLEPLVAEVLDEVVP
jgi:hypothetical protein